MLEKLQQHPFMTSAWVFNAIYYGEAILAHQSVFPPNDKLANIAFPASLVAYGALKVTEKRRKRQLEKTIPFVYEAYKHHLQKQLPQFAQLASEYFDLHNMLNIHPTNQQSFHLDMMAGILMGSLSLDQNQKHEDLPQTHSRFYHDLGIFLTDGISDIEHAMLEDLEAKIEQDEKEEPLAGEWTRDERKFAGLYLGATLTKTATNWIFNTFLSEMPIHPPAVSRRQQQMLTHVSWLITENIVRNDGEQIYDIQEALEAKKELVSGAIAEIKETIGMD